MGDWHIALNGKRQGPLSEQDLRRGLQTGEFPPETLVWTEGMGEWQSAQSAILSPIPDEVEKTRPLVWRSEMLLVMRRDAVLPDVCIKTNLPANGRRFKQTLYWHPSAWYLLVLVNLIVYAIVALIVRKSAPIDVGISQDILDRRKRATLIATGITLAGLLLMFLPIMVGNSEQGAFAALFFLGLLGFLGGLIGVSRVRRVVTPTRIDDTYIWVKGAHPDFLGRFPVFVPESA